MLRYVGARDRRRHPRPLLPILRHQLRMHPTVPQRRRMLQSPPRRRQPRDVWADLRFATTMTTFTGVCYTYFYS